MSVVVKHGKFALHDVPFLVPVVDAGAPALVGRVVSELRRVGWDVPGIDVTVAARGAGKEVFRAVESVSGTHDGSAFKFDLRSVRESKSGRRATVTGFGDVLLAHPDGYMVPASRERSGEVMRGVVERLGKMPTSPDPDAALSSSLEVERAPAPPDFPVLYVWEERNGIAKRAADGDAPDVVLAGDGWRLTPGSTVADPLAPPRAFDGFNYASTSLDARIGHRSIATNDDALPVEVRLRWLNDVFVVDGAAYDRLREDSLASARGHGRETLRQSEIDACTRAMAMTMVEARDYDGSFAAPVYLVGRQLRSDEARVMRGRVTVENGADRTRIRVVDHATGRGFDAWRSRRGGPDAAIQARREAAFVSSVFEAVETRENLSVAGPERAPEEPEMAMR